MSLATFTDNDVTGKEVRDSPVSQSVRIASRTKALVLTVAKVKPSRGQIGAGRKKKTKPGTIPPKRPTVSRSKKGLEGSLQNCSFVAGKWTPLRPN